MLSPNQLQDLAIILNTDVEDIKSTYESADVDLVDEMALIDTLSDSIDNKDSSAVKTILLNYPVFDKILLKNNIMEQVLQIDKLEQITIVESLTKEVLDSFKDTPLYEILKEAQGDTLEEKNECIRKKIMEKISPISYMKPIMEGISVSREKKHLFESQIATFYKDCGEKALLTKIRELHKHISSLPIVNGQTNPSYKKCKEELDELERLYDERFGYKFESDFNDEEVLEEDVIEPIKPIEPSETIEQKEDKSEDSEETIEEFNDELEQRIENNEEIDPILLKRAFGDINTDSLSDLYKDMDSDELQDHLDAIEEYLN